VAVTPEVAVEIVTDEENNVLFLRCYCREKKSNEKERCKKAIHRCENRSPIADKQDPRLDRVWSVIKQGQVIHPTLFGIAGDTI
jgi:hypothetical protein